MSILRFAGKSEKGIQELQNNDYIQIEKIDQKGEITLAMIADGTASLYTARITPATMVCSEVTRALRRAYAKQKDWFLEDPEYFLSEAFHLANRLIGGMQIANESIYGTSGVSATACLFYGKNQIAFAHIGNTRLYRVRITPILDEFGREMADDNGTPIFDIDMKQLTVDHTEAQRKVANNMMDARQYYASPDRFALTRGLGVLAEPEIDTSSGRLKDGDLILLTSDGVHYALTPENFNYLLLTTGDPDKAVEAFMEGVKQTEYPDDASIISLYLAPEAESKD